MASAASAATTSTASRSGRPTRAPVASATESSGAWSRIGACTPLGVHAGRKELVTRELQRRVDEAEGDGHGHEQRDQRQDALRIDAGPAHRKVGEVTADAQAEGGERRQAQPPQQQRRDRLQQPSLEHALAREQHVGGLQGVEHRDRHREDPACELRQQHEREPCTGDARCQQRTAPFRRLLRTGSS